MSIRSKRYVWYHVEERHDIAFLRLRNRLYVRRGGEYLLLRPFSWRKTSETWKPEETALIFAVIPLLPVSLEQIRLNSEQKSFRRKKLRLKQRTDKLRTKLYQPKGHEKRKEELVLADRQKRQRGKRAKSLPPLPSGKQTYNRQVLPVKPGCFSWSQAVGTKTQHSIGTMIFSTERLILIFRVNFTHSV